jgi:hypothetical protein
MTIYKNPHDGIWHIKGEPVNGVGYKISCNSSIIDENWDRIRIGYGRPDCKPCPPIDEICIKCFHIKTNNHKK